jgi:hypothetical protein
VDLDDLDRDEQFNMRDEPINKVSKGLTSKSMYYIEENANVVVVGTYITFKICWGR